MLTSRADVMRSFASARRTRIAGWLTVAVIIALNAVLLGQLAYAPLLNWLKS
jgi:manganese transport protein